MRVGLLGKKIGMTRIFDKLGNHHPVTVVECPEAVVLSAGKNAPSNVSVASFDVKDKAIKKPQLGEFKKVSSSAKRYITEYKVSKIEEFKEGSIITVKNFVEGQFVDVRGRTVGKGFAGAMKRHGFAGLEATHGVSISHRSHGSTGQCQDPGRVFKGKKMAGHMGATNVSVQNLEVLKVDEDSSLLYIRGAVPGKRGAILRITDSIKKSVPSNVSFPAYFKESAKKVEEVTSETTVAVENSENK